jgi:hypothetical protein
MTEPPRFGFVGFLLFLGVLAVAAATRGWYLWHECDQGRQEGPAMVQDDPGPYLTKLVDNLSQSNGFVSRPPLSKEDKETAYTAPGYPLLLSAFRRAPVLLSSVEQEVRWFQWLLGTLTAGLYYLFARRAFYHPLVALLTGLVCAVYPFWIINTAEIDDGVLTTFFLALCLFLGARGGQSGGALTSFLYGIALAGLALVRAALLPFAFAAELWFLLRCRRLKGGWIYGVLAFLGFLTGLAPWAMRTYQVRGDVFPIVDSAYLHLWMGNNPLATGGPQSEEKMQEALKQIRADQGEASTATPSSREFAQYAFAEMRAWPAETLQRRIQAGLDFALGEEWFREQKLWRGAVSPDVAALLYASLLAMLVLGGIGWRWSYAWRHEAKPSSLAVIWVPLPYLLGHAEALQGPRLPLDGVLLCYAAFALVCLLPVGRSLFRGPRPAGTP